MKDPIAETCAAVARKLYSDAHVRAYMHYGDEKKVLAQVERVIARELRELAKASEDAGYQHGIDFVASGTERRSNGTALAGLLNAAQTQAVSEMREKMECGHPRACLEISFSELPDGPATEFQPIQKCSACEELKEELKRFSSGE